MAITKEQKKEIIKKAEEALKASSVVFVNFKGLSVLEANELRRALRELGITYFVAKKTLIKLAFDKSKFAGQMPDLNGEVALAWGDDEIMPAKKIYEFQKSHEGKIGILGGVFSGEYRDQIFMTQIAKIPSQKELYGQFVQMISWPTRSLVMTLKQIADSKQTA